MLLNDVSVFAGEDQEHVSGKRRWQYYLWDVLMFQAWLRRDQEFSGSRICAVETAG